MTRIVFAASSLFFQIILSLIFASQASAHVKWFVQETQAARSFSLSEGSVFLLLVVCIAVLSIAFFLDHKVKISSKLSKILERYENSAASILSSLTGIALITFSFSGFVLAPNLIVQADTASYLTAFQAVVGVFLLLGFLTRLSAILLLLLYLITCIKFGLTNILETFEIVGISIFLLILGRPKWAILEVSRFKKIFAKYQEYAIPSLRIATGLNLIFLALVEKLLNPALGETFLQSFHWNFLKQIGLSNFSDRMFVLFAGGFEALFGLLLVLGLVTRLTALALFGFFTTTLVLLGPKELVGHLPHFAIVIVLLVFGSGRRLRVN